MKKNHLILPLLSVLAVGALTGCAGGQTGDKDAVTITLWTTLSYQTQLEAYKASFEEKYPHITVENVKVSGSYDDLKTNTINGFPTDNYPDLVLAYPDHVADYLDYAKAADITSYMEDPQIGWSRADRADFIENYITEGQSYSVKGTYSLPFCKSTEAMYYNASVLVGLNLSTIDPTINGGQPLTASYIENLTWEELFTKLCPAILTYNEQAGEKDKILKQAEDGKWAVVGYDSDDNLFITLAEQYGLPYTSVDTTTGKGSADWNTPEMRSLLKTWNAAKNAHYVMTKGTTGGYVNTEFTDNSCLFSIGSTGGVKYQHTDSFEIGVSKIPHAANGKDAVINQGPSLAFLKHKNSENKIDTNRIEASWLFYKHMTEEANATSWATATGYMPVRTSCYESEAYLEYCSTEGKEDLSVELLTALSSSYTGTVLSDLFTSPVFKGSSECRTQVGGLLTAILKLTAAECTDAKIQELFETSVNNAKLKF